MKKVEPSTNAGSQRQWMSPWAVRWRPRRGLRLATTANAIAILLLFILGSARLTAAPLLKLRVGKAYQHAAIITVHGVVDQIQQEAIIRRIHQATELHASLLIFRFRSTTGLLHSALAAAHAIAACHIPTVAYVRSAAIGPALLMAAACRSIIMHRHAVIGDGQVFQSQQPLHFAAGTPVPQGKPMKWLFHCARNNGYPAALLAAMVDPEVVLDEVSNRQTGQTRLVTPGLRRKWMLQTIPGHRGNHPWVFIRRFKRAGAVLTLSGRRAKQFGLAVATVRSRSALLAKLNVTQIKVPVLRLSLMEHAMRLLVSPGIRFLLILVLVVAGWLTLTHPGWHLPILVGIVALGLLLGAPMLTGVGQWWEIVLAGAGILLIFYDIFHFGGLGLLAIPGFVLVLIGVGCSLIPLNAGYTSPEPVLTAAQISGGVLAAALLFGIIACLLIVQFMHRLPGTRRMVLAPPKPAESAMTDNSGLFAGSIGRAVSDLRPAGKANFDGQLTDVVTSGEYISAGTPIVVLGRTQQQWMVKALG
jgi:membrane-bound serine protease (ClpP class)